MIEVIWYGRGGQGCFTASRLLGIASSIFDDKSALAFPSFGPERRGAPVRGFTKISEEKIRDRTASPKADYAIVLDETLINEEVYTSLKEHGTIIVNTKHRGQYLREGIRVIEFDALSKAEKILGKPITNSAMLGVLASVSDVVSIDAVLKAVDYEMKGVAAKNNKRLIQSISEEFKDIF